MPDQPLTAVDLGCYSHGREISIDTLIQRYRPTILYGFDPWPELIEGEGFVDGSRVVLERKAAWLYDGTIAYAPAKLDATVVADKNSRDEWGGEHIEVPCFDFSAWLDNLGERVICKMDVEGAEFGLLERLHEDGTDELILELLIEWHDARMGVARIDERRELEASLRCPVVEWA